MARAIASRKRISVCVEALEPRALLSVVSTNVDDKVEHHVTGSNTVADVQRLVAGREHHGQQHDLGLAAAKARKAHHQATAARFKHDGNVHAKHPDRTTVGPDTSVKGAAMTSVLKASSQSSKTNTSSSTVVARGTRDLGIAVTTAADGNYSEAFNLAKSVGMSSTTLALNWTDIEYAPGQYGNSFLGIANSYYAAEGTKVDLIIRPINTNQISMPSDLAGLTFNNPEVIARFEQMLSYVFSQIPNVTLEALAIGNEVDDYLGTNSQLWAQYQTFYDAVSSYARSLRPGLDVGVVATYAGLTGPAESYLAALNSQSNVIMLTYYPVESNFAVEAPSVVAPNWNTLTAIYAGRPIIFTEVGYPTSSVNGGSQSLQSTFVDDIFAAWDAHASQVESVTFSWLTDVSQSTAQQYQSYYGTTSNSALNFFETLGLRTNPGSGANKLAFTTLEQQAALRGW